jgi:hypothetical protein
MIPPPTVINVGKLKVLSVVILVVFKLNLIVDRDGKLNVLREGSALEVKLPPMKARLERFTLESVGILVGL